MTRPPLSVRLSQRASWRASLAAATAAGLWLLGAGAGVWIAPPATAAGTQCPPITVEDSSKAARAVFSGTVESVQRVPRDDGVPGAIYVQTVSVDEVYQGRVRTETLQVQTDRNRVLCSLGELVVGSPYMFFVVGTGEPWVAGGTSGTRPSDPTVVTEVEALLGAGRAPIAPTPEEASFTKVWTATPQRYSRAAAPGAAMVVVGLLGLVLVGWRTRRSGPAR